MFRHFVTVILLLLVVTLSKSINKNEVGISGEKKKQQRGLHRMTVVVVLYKCTKLCSILPSLEGNTYLTSFNGSFTYSIFPNCMIPVEKIQLVTLPNIDQQLF